MTEVKKNPLFIEVEGDAQMWAGITLEYNRKLGRDLYYGDKSIAFLKGAEFRGDKESGLSLIAYHPEFTDGEGDRCRRAVYEFYNLQFEWAGDGYFSFTGLLTGIAHWSGEEIPKDQYSGYEYTPPQVAEKYLPLFVKVDMWIPSIEDKRGE